MSTPIAETPPLITLPVYVVRHALCSPLTVLTISFGRKKLQAVQFPLVSARHTPLLHVVRTLGKSASFKGLVSVRTPRKSLYALGLPRKPPPFGAPGVQVKVLSCMTVVLQEVTPLSAL